MPAINSITNPDKLVEKKINYFLDCFNQAISYAGWHSSLELETPTSLIEKILFRLTEDTEYRLLYLDNYFKNSFFITDTFWDGYSTYAVVKKTVSKYNSLTPRQKLEKIKLIDSSTFQNNLRRLLRDLTYKMPEDLINAVIYNSLCPHQLNELIPKTAETHAESFASCALTLASEYLLRGYTKSEIREIIDRVFSKNEQEFPFPSRVQTKLQRQKHLAEGTLKNQLHGFTNAFNLKPTKGIIMVKVFGGNFPSDFEFKYNKVRFWGKEHPFIAKVKSQIPNDGISDFFDSGDYILASAEIDWFSDDSLLEKIKSTVRQELVYLSAILDRDFSVDTTQNYLRFDCRLKYKGLAWSSRKFDNLLSKDALEELNNNGYSALRKLKGQAIDWFLNCEHLFINAYKNESVSDYWLYLETLLSFNRKSKRVKEIVSLSILNNEVLIRNRRILTTIMDSFTPFNGGIRLLGVTPDRWRQIWKNARKGAIAKEIRKLDYPFIQELIKEFDGTLNAKYYKEAKEYYYRMLTEAYEYRNSFVHKGITTE
ncbi:MAG TPA: hypothetical protein VHD35_15135, partial [Chitinophagaceae bacterium]|nr:hypothetical protein [Chitinophagaceae bacterium]